MFDNDDDDDDMDVLYAPKFFCVPREKNMRLLKITKSSRPDKKYQAEFVTSDGRRKTVHFGAAGYGNFIAWSARAKALGRAKRRAYLARHGATENWTRPDTPATLSRYVLWERRSLKNAIREYKRRFRL